MKNVEVRGIMLNNIKVYLKWFLLKNKKDWIFKSNLLEHTALLMQNFHHLSHQDNH